MYNNIHPKFGVVLFEEAFVPEIIVPFAAIILVAVQYAYTAFNEYRFKIIMDQVISPAV